MKSTPSLLVAMSACAVAAITTLPSAHAESSMSQFLSPSGNIGCQLGTDPEGAAYAWCKVDDHTWPAPSDTVCAVANLPGAIGEPGGEDLQLSQGKSPCFGFVMSQLFFDGEYSPATLEYGGQQSVGSITCTVETSGVTCTDATTGRFFQVSADSYVLG